MAVKNWAPIPLGVVCLKIGSGATPRGGSDVYLQNGQYTLIRSQNVYNDGFHREGLAFIDEKHAAELENVEVLNGDVLLNITGDSVARVCQVDPGILPARVNQHVMIIRPDSNILSPRFLRYFLVSPEMQTKLMSWAGSGGTRNALTKVMIESFEVLAPVDVTEQSAIASVLGTLDDKIELNQRVNKTLEEMLRALFNSWFVDFDPVHAKAASRNSGLSKEIAKIFPHTFVNTELGKIPRGWCVGMLGDVAEHPRRGVHPEEIDPLTPYIALEHMPRRCIALTEWGIADGLESDKFIFTKGEILYGKLRPYFHKVGVAPVTGICSSDIVVIKPRVDKWFGFVLGHVSSQAFVEHTNAGSTGTKMPRTSWSEMARYSIVLPEKSIVDAFSEMVGPIISRILTSIHESRALADLRDTLLPKVISGELRVKNAEKIIGRLV